MEGKQRIEEILRDVSGLEEFFREKGIGEKYRLTALVHDKRSGLVGYALQGKTPTLCFPAGLIVAGVYMGGKSMEKYFASYPIVDVSLWEYDGNARYSARLHEDCVNQNPQTLDFPLYEMKGGERENGKNS